MSQELKLGLLELNDIYYALSTVSKDKNVYAHERMAVLANKVLTNIIAECEAYDELISAVRDIRDIVDNIPE